MFLERGFDHVRVSDIAEACHVSTKTIYNYFPTKESLLLDRGESLATSLETAMDESGDVLAAVLALIKDNVCRLVASAGPSATVADSEDIRTVKAFAALVESKPSLRGAVGEQVDRLTQLAARALAARSGTSMEAPENQIAASALISLWQVELRGLLRFANTNRPLCEVRDEVLSDVDRGIRMVQAMLKAHTT